MTPSKTLDAWLFFKTIKFMDLYKYDEVRILTKPVDLIFLYSRKLFGSLPNGRGGVGVVEGRGRLPIWPTSHDMENTFLPFGPLAKKL
jgi:hypothetical protein